MDKKNRLIGIGAAVAIAVGIAVAIGAQNPDSSAPETSGDSRVVFWRHVHGLGVDPSYNNILYIATHGDFYQSVNGGPPVKVDEQRADYMAFNAPQTEGVPLYASGHPSTGGNTGLIKSTDGGKTWQVVSAVLEPAVDFHAMAVSKSDPNIIMGFDSGERGLFKTTDAGETWNKLEYPEYVLALAIAPEDPKTVFAGTIKGIFQSSDGGTSWVQLNEYKGIQVFALSFGADGILYASTETFGLSKSSDFGKTWEKIERPDLIVNSIATDSNTIYVAGFSPEGYQEVYRSTGEEWQLVGTNKES